jgi:carbon storage regulator CsrA
MLVTKRRLGEAVRIGTARVVVLELDRRRVTLGIEAPADMPIVREEARDGGQEKAP